MSNIISENTDTQRAWIKTIKYIALIATAISLGTSGSKALANCTLLEGSTGRILAPFTIPPLDSRTPINGVLATVNTTASGTLTKIDCTTPSPKASFESDFSYIGNQLYATDLLGISMHINVSDAGNMPFVISSSGNVWTIQPTQNIRIQFIKTSPTIEGGTVAPKILSRATSVESPGFILQEVYMPIPWTVTLLRPTCQVNTPNISVDLGEVSIIDFNTLGRTQPVDFSIDLDCTGGTDTTNVYVTMTDASNPGNTTSLLGLTPGSDAQGIALEVNNRNGQVTFGPDLSGTGNPGQWLDGDTAAGSYSIPLSVNYVRLPGPIKGGTANSGVTYTLNYD